MIFVDPPAWPWRGRLFSHVVSDTDVAELHALARAAGVHPRAFDGDHYDVPEELYGAVVAAGARPVDGHELVRRLNASGLRVRKRRGDKLLDVVDGGFAWLGVPHRVEVVRSAAAPTTAVAVATFVRDTRPPGPQGPEGPQGARGVLLLRHPRRGGWESPGGWVEPGEAPVEAAAREVAEETGLRLAAADLVPVGYERVTFLGEVPPGRWAPTSHVAVFEAHADLGGLPGAGPEGAALSVVDDREAERRCGRAPWWPLLADRLGVPLPPPSWAR